MKKLQFSFIVIILVFIGLFSACSSFMYDYTTDTYFDDYYTDNNNEYQSKDEFYGKATMFKSMVNYDNKVKKSKLYSVNYEDKTSLHNFENSGSKEFVMVDVLSGSGLFPNISVCWDLDGEYLPFIIMKMNKNEWIFIKSFERNMIGGYKTGTFNGTTGIVTYIVYGDYFLFGIKNNDLIVTEKEYHPLYDGECLSRDYKTRPEEGSLIFNIDNNTRGYPLTIANIKAENPVILSKITNIEKLEKVLNKNINSNFSEVK